MRYYGITSIEECDCDEVWDITLGKHDDFLEGEPNFVAQNIVVHNSHAAGFIISDVELSEIAPLHITAGQDDQEDDASNRDKTIATQYVASDAESLGLIKFDLLGLLTKTVVSMTTKLIKDRYQIDIDIDSLPMDDPKTLALLHSAKTDGIFQLEEPGMQRTVRDIGIDSFYDVPVVIAMYRPGPLQFIPEYARRKRDPSSVRYIHPIVEKYTKKTYGIIVYQEQAMRIFVDLAGLTNYDGSMFIKGSAKKKPELFQSMKDRFIQGATKRASKEVAEEVWRQMEPFQGYAFNAAHAVSYAYESWVTAYLKANYPLEFMASRLSIAVRDRKFDSAIKLEQDCYRTLGIKILPPDINESKLDYAIVGEKTLRKPLLIKGVGERAAEEIVKHQPYRGKDLIESFTMKVGSVIDSRVVEGMCDAGLFGDAAMTPSGKKKILRAFEVIKDDRKRSKGQQRGDLFG